MNVGERDRLITVERATVTTDDYGGEIPGAFSTLEQAWARVRFGRADEKRRAAQEGGDQSATFEVLPTQALLGVQLTDRIQFDGSAWNIKEVAPLDRNVLRFTAVRSK